MSCDVLDASGVAGKVRALVPPPESVADTVREIVAAVASQGDRALLEYEQRFGGSSQALRVETHELAAARDGLDPAVREGLETAITNVAEVARAALSSEVGVTLAEGHSVRLREVPVRRAAVYAPGGAHPYPSSVVMGVVTARAAGVDRVVVAAPAHPIILGACALCGADEVYRMGGAQAIAALAYGTESVSPVDVIVGPGNLYVQEAKVQVSGRVGIDGFAGPSDLCVVASAGADPEPLALDLLAQAEHGSDSVAVAVSDDLDFVEALIQHLRLEVRGRVAGDGVLGRLAVVEASDTVAALAFAEAFAPEHLQLVGREAEALAPRVRNAGCVLVGSHSGTAFSDYVAGSNHTLPTDGRARFASGLTVRHFRRTMSEIRLNEQSAHELGVAGVPIAQAEGFGYHAASMQARMRGQAAP